MINKEKNWPYLVLGIASFFIFTLELILFIAEMKIYGVSESAPFAFSFSQILRHWIFTFILWGSSAFLLHTIAKKKLGYNMFAFKEKINAISILIVFIISILHVAYTTYDWNWTFKPIAELNGMVRTYGSNGSIAYAFQVVYYLFEDLAMLLVVAFGQKFGERQFDKKMIPWGGILLALTWGLFHYVTQGSIHNALYCCAISIYFGICYLLLKKNAFCSWMLFFVLYTI